MRYAALAICACFILWLFKRDKKLRPMTSWGVWVTFFWVMLIGSKSTGYWLGGEVVPDPTTQDYLDGSPLDRNVFLTLLLLGSYALYKRKIDWGKVISSNRWLFAFFLYYALSILWSDYPFVSFKRWIKDIGNILMVLLMLSEARPVEAVKAVMCRYIYAAIPLSLLLIYFFPEIGLSRDLLTGDTLVVGITTDKNELGVVLAISGLFIAWDLLELLKGDKSGKKLDILLRTALLGMVISVISIARSATSLLCLAIGIALLLLMRVSALRNQVRNLGTYALVATFTIFSLFVFTDVTELMVKMVEKDMTFTGRTDIWAGLVSEPINPLIGTGYSSFWLQPAMMGSYHNIIQAHNGYLETYLNGGWLGVFFLAGLILATGHRVRNEIITGSSFAVLLFTVFVISLFYNLSETMFNRLDLVWFMFLVAALRYPKQQASAEAVIRPMPPTNSPLPRIRTGSTGAS
jgi:exopolysaccharide production protein ExoQ